MAKNNGRRKTKGRSSKNSNNQPTIARWLWILTALIIGGLITFLLVITRSAPPTESKPNYPVNSTPPAGTEKPKTKFDFYEMLPSKQVNPPMEEPLEVPPDEPVPEIPKEQPIPAEKKPTQEPSTATKPVPPPVVAPEQKTQQAKPIEQKPAAKQYMVQVGAFKKFDDADQLKAELTLLGFPVMIQSVNTNGNLLFKVRSGPYADKPAATAAMNDLDASGFTGQVVQE